MRQHPVSSIQGERPYKTHPRPSCAVYTYEVYAHRYSLQRSLGLIEQMQPHHHRMQPSLHHLSDAIS